MINIHGELVVDEWGLATVFSAPCLLTHFTLKQLEEVRRSLHQRPNNLPEIMQLMLGGGGVKLTGGALGVKGPSLN